MHTSTPISAEDLQELEPARVQFIEQSFEDLLDGADGGGRSELLRWVHRRLFLDGAGVDAVRMELTHRRRSTRFIAVTSGKGGVGKTTFSVNLAVALARQGHRVLLFDADLGMANTHLFAGVNPAATLLDVVDRRADLRDVLVPGPAGVQMICGASGVGRLANLGEPVLDALGRELQLLAADFDVVVMDTGAGISHAVTRFVRMAHDAVVVTTANLASILDAYGILKLVHENRLAARLHVLVNQADGEAEAAGVQERIARCADRFLQSAPPGNLGCLLRDSAVERANQSRRPLQLSDPDNLNARRIARIATRLVGPARSKPAFRTTAV